MANPPLSPVDPVRPPAAWIGGKRHLARRIVSLINQTPHKAYCEPFVGMGGVFFRRNHAPAAEVINDRSGEVVNLFRILQRHYPQFMDTLRFQIASRREFERLSKADPATLTDLERAARFLYLQRLAFGGKVTGQNFGVDAGRSSRFNLLTLGRVLEDVHERLAGVTIENLDWLAFIDRYDRPGTLFYLDPPYWGNETDYGAELFARDDFEAMALCLARLKGSFILSINDRPVTRECFSRFTLEGADVHYSVAGGKGTKARELIVRE